jgi:CheY-like chemotaxis protein
MLAKIIGMKLEEENYQVDHAYDGMEAYAMLSKSELPDLVLLDVLLPKMSGFDVLERLRNEGRPLPKVIVFSNFAQKADVERAHALGAVDYIVKAAFSPAEILSKINSILAVEETAPVAAPDAAPQETPPTVVPPPAATPPTPTKQEDPYAGFQSLQDVVPMSEVIRPGEPNNNP